MWAMSFERRFSNSSFEYCLLRMQYCLWRRQTQPKRSEEFMLNSQYSMSWLSAVKFECFTLNDPITDIES